MCWYATESSSKQPHIKKTGHLLCTGLIEHSVNAAYKFSKHAGRDAGLNARRCKRKLARDSSIFTCH